MRGSTSNISPALAARLGPPVSGSEVARGGEGGRGGAGTASQQRRGGSDVATSGSEAARTNAARGGSDYSRLRGIIRTQKDTIQVGLQHASVPGTTRDPFYPGTPPYARSNRATLKRWSWDRAWGLRHCTSRAGASPGSHDKGTVAYAQACVLLCGMGRPGVRGSGQ